jgi:hypothetical protein
MKLTEWHAQRIVYGYRRDTYAVMVPNYTPDDWHECDLFGVTRAGYFHEYEIKLTRGDFRADAAKRLPDRYRHVPVDGTTFGRYDRVAGQRKHDRIGSGDAKGPSRFFYVMPRDMVPVDEVPAWAGLFHLVPWRQTVRLEQVRDAPKLHAGKVDRHVFRHASHVCYFRFWDERLARWRLQDAAHAARSAS